VTQAPPFFPQEPQALLPTSQDASSAPQETLEGQNQLAQPPSLVRPSPTSYKVEHPTPNSAGILPRYKSLFNTSWLMSICHFDHTWTDEGARENLAKLQLYLTDADLTRCHQVRQLLLRVTNRLSTSKPDTIAGRPIRHWVGPVSPPIDFELRTVLDQVTKMGGQFAAEGQKLRFQTDDGYWKAWVKMPNPGRQLINKWDHHMMWAGWWLEDEKEREAHMWWLWIVSGTMRGLHRDPSERR
jgi:hypothetical protein